MADRTFGRSRPLARYAVAAACAVILTGCAATGQKGDVLGGEADYRDAVGAFTNPEADPASLDPIAAAAFWGTRFDREPRNADVAVRYSAALRKIGSTDEAVTVMAKAVGYNPDHPAVQLEYGKALVEEGRSFEAVRYLENAVAAKRNDWRAYSAYGVALDQIGENEMARKQYDKALLLAPGAVSVMNNKALSYALSGDLETAETILRAATAKPGSTARIRQNLALVLAIKGDMREASRLARSDLPPQIADQNIDYFRSLMSQPAYWQDYAQDAVDAPDFDAIAPEPSEKDAAPEPRPLPELREQPKNDEREDKDAPIALSGATPATNASAEAGASVANYDSSPELKN